MALTKAQIEAMIVDEAEVPTARRGRQRVVNADLAAILSAVKPGKAARLDSVLGVHTDKTEQSKVAQTIRTHWTEIYGDRKCSIGWVDGKPSVKFAAVKAN